MGLNAINNYTRIKQVIFIQEISTHFTIPEQQFSL